jgi:hypothetical protein
MKRYLLSNAIRDWLEPFKYDRVTYYTHQRVRFLAWLLWALNICVTTLYGFFFALATVALAIIGIENGVTVSPEYVIGLFAAKVCGGNNCSSPEYLMGAMFSVALITALFTLVFLALQPVNNWKPAKVTDEELDEFRMLGYIVMEAEDYSHALDEYRADTDRGADRSGRLSESGQLDQAGPADCRAEPETEGAGQFAEVH